MMGIFADLFSGGLLKGIKDIIGSFKLDPEKKLELEKIIEEHAEEIRMKEFELQVKTMELEKASIESASANIRAEAQSGDKFTSRARPTFLYLFYVILAFNFLFLQLLK
jgi:hypothetical protein